MQCLLWQPQLKLPNIITQANETCRTKSWSLLYRKKESVWLKNDHILLETDIPLVHNSRATCVSGQPTSGHTFLCIV